MSLLVSPLFPACIAPGNHLRLPVSLVFPDTRPMPEVQTHTKRACLIYPFGCCTLHVNKNIYIYMYRTLAEEGLMGITLLEDNLQKRISHMRACNVYPKGTLCRGSTVHSGLCTRVASVSNLFEQQYLIDISQTED